MSTLFAMAWRNITRQWRRSVITVSMMALALAMCIAGMALQSGEMAQMRTALVGRQLGDFQLHNPAWLEGHQIWDGVADAETLADKLAQDPRVSAVLPRLYGSALAGGEHRSEGVQLMGLEPAIEARARDLERQVKSGHWLADDEDHAVVLGVDLARTLEVGPGDAIILVSSGADGSIANDAFVVAGTISFAVPQLDQRLIVMRRSDLQRFLTFEGQAHEIMVVTHDHDDATIEAAMAQIAPDLGPDVRMQPWWQLNPSLRNLFELADVLRWLIAAIFIGISAVGVVNTLLMSVMERTREFGVMRALGVRPSGLVGLVVLESLLLGLSASVVGLTLGLLGDAYLIRYGVTFAVEQNQGFKLASIELDPVIYGMFVWHDVAIPMVVLFVVAVLAAVPPARRVARLEPISAMRGR